MRKLKAAQQLYFSLFMDCNIVFAVVQIVQKIGRFC
jgi:hypothetical protein